MGKLYCLKCAQTVEAPSFAQADSLIDHAGTSKKCSGNPDYMRWNNEKIGSVITAKVTKKATSTNKKK